MSSRINFVKIWEKFYKMSYDCYTCFTYSYSPHIYTRRRDLIVEKQDENDNNHHLTKKFNR